MYFEVLRVVMLDYAVSIHPCTGYRAPLLGAHSLLPIVFNHKEQNKRTIKFHSFAGTKRKKLTTMRSLPATASALSLLASIVAVAGQTSDFGALQSRLEIAIFGLNAAAFQDPASYQSQALQRTSQQVGVDNFTNGKLAQYYTLYCVYYATYAVPNEITLEDPRFDGIVFPTWLISTNWDQINVDPCNGWHGIVCDSNGKVTEINLFENTLTGTWPEEVKLLAGDGPFSTGAGNITQIDLFRNEFLTNGGDSSWMSDLGSGISKFALALSCSGVVCGHDSHSNCLLSCRENVATIMLEETAFSGDLPLMPASLVNFNAADANFTGGFNDANFAPCVNLNYLDLELNKFNTSIPAVLSTLPNLEFLYLSDTLMVGTLAPIQSMPVVRELWMDANPRLVGPIESWIGDMMTLESLSLAYNNLSGSLPSEMGLLTNLKQLWLYGNNFTGRIPPEIGALNSLAILQLEGNSLQGWVPPTICEKTEFPAETLKSFGADCHDDGFWCPCCSCCDLAECVAVSSSTRKDRKERRRYLRR
jgi:hypothetical protein